MHNMEQLIPANILIGDRNYRIKIKSEDEEKLRKTVRQLMRRLSSSKLILQERRCRII